MDKKEIRRIFLFGAILIFFALFSTKLRFHDAYEYINIAKNFAGIENIDLFSAHSLFYPLIISFFLKVWPTETMMKIVNVSWIFLMGIVLLLWTKNKKAFILFAFSPLVWFMSIQTTPVLPASFFLLLSFLFFHRNDIRFNLAYSGIFLGFSCALYTPMLLVSSIFILIYFWGESFKDFILFLFSLGIGFLPRMIQDYYLFKMPIYSVVRYIGANFIIAIGGNSETANFNLLGNLEILSVLFLISPLLFLIYRVDFIKHRKHLIFVGLISLIFFFRVQQIKYFLILTPIIMIILSRYLSEKEVEMHAIISIFLTLFLTVNFFFVSEDVLIRGELSTIEEEYEKQCFIAGKHDANALAAIYWEETPRFIWWQDYIGSIENKTTLKTYALGIEPRIPLRTQLEIVGNFNRGSDKTYKDCILVLRRGVELDSTNFELSRCYQQLCVYEEKETFASNSGA